MLNSRISRPLGRGSALGFSSLSLLADPVNTFHLNFKPFDGDKTVYFFNNPANTAAKPVIEYTPVHGATLPDSEKPELKTSQNTQRLKLIHAMNTICAILEFFKLKNKIETDQDELPPVLKVFSPLIEINSRWNTQSVSYDAKTETLSCIWKQ